MLDALSQITTKDLILIGIGSIVTLILFFIRIFKDFVSEYKSITPLLGRWHTYHSSRVNYQTVFRHEIWDVKRSLIGLKIKTIDNERPGLSYSGRVLFDASHIVLEFKGSDHKEIKQYRLTQPIPNEDTLMIGFHISKDFDQEIFASSELVSRNERSTDEVLDILRDGFVWNEKENSLRLSKRPIPAKVSKKDV